MRSPRLAAHTPAPTRVPALGAAGDAGGDPAPAARAAAGGRGQRARDALLGAARTVAAEAGWQAVTVRRVAERAGCSPALVYEYFASKDALLLALVRDGFGLLRARVQAARGAAAAGDYEAALGAMVRAYWTFAREHADLYQVMYGLGGTRFPAGETWAEGAAVGEAFAPVIAALSGLDAAGDVERRVYTVWATVHGLIALVLAGRIAGAWPAGEALADAALRDALASWTAGRAAPGEAGPRGAG